MSYAQVASNSSGDLRSPSELVMQRLSAPLPNSQVCGASNVVSNVAKKAITYVQHKVTNKKMTPYIGDLVCSPYRGSSKKPYCAVCFKAGKSIEIYTNHFTKSSLGPDAVVVCPTILAAACSYCKKTGHFKSVCPILKEKEKNGVKRDVGVKHSLHVSQRSMPSISAFAALDMDSDDDEVVTDIVTMGSEVTEDCDTISTNMSYTPTVMTYASVCASTHSCNKATMPQEFVVLDSSTTPSFTIKNLTHSWADDDYWSDEE